MAKKKLFKSKSNFSIRRLHQSGNYGNIYERDYTTIVNSLDNPGGQIPIFNSPTFKLTIGANLNKKKRYFYGNWENNPSSLNSNWTLDNMPTSNSVDNKFELNLKSKKLTDYACYGSSAELIKASLSNIVSNFPAEIYVTDNILNDKGVFDVVDDLGTVSTGSTMYGYRDYVIVDNPFFIDIIQNSVPENSLVNKLRYLCDSITEYNILDGNGTIVSNGEAFKEWNANHNDNKSMRTIILPQASQLNNENCLTNGDLLATVKFYSIDENGTTENVIDIICFYLNGGLFYLTNPSKKGYRIKPNSKNIEKFFNGLSDFEKVILNRKTNYSAVFEYYKEYDEHGWLMKEKTYKWPTSKGDWNISINGPAYSKYIEDLTELSISYDELFTNSIQRDMTHESINNMDLTGGVLIENDEAQLNSAKMTKILNVVGRQFDEIKKYADNIKSTNIITYTQEQNTPDYFLTDSLDLSGWEVKEILNGVSSDIVTPPMYSSRGAGFNANEANNEFLRRLKLNSKHIFSKKGTKQGIEDLMAVFGYHSTDWLRRYYGSLLPMHLRKAYILSEHTYVANGYASNKTDDDFVNNVKRINQLKDSFDIDGINNPDGYYDDLQGIPVAEINTTIPSDSTQSNTLISDNVPTEKNNDYKYIKVNNDYYEWVGYRQLTQVPIDYNDRKIIYGTTIPTEKVESNAKYIVMRLYYYQWAGAYKKLLEKPLDAVNVSNYKIVTNAESLNTKDNSVQYLVFNSKYYEWDSNAGENKEGAYVMLDNEPSNLQTKNTKAYNSVPNIQDKEVKYIIFRGEYYEWSGKYVSTGNPPNDSTSGNTSYRDVLPEEEDSTAKKYIALNTYFIWDGLYKLYNKKVIVPWFDKTLKYDGGTYFQMKGAWGRNDGKTDDPEITETSVYAYSVSKVHYATNLEELFNIPYRNIDVNGIYYIGNDDTYYKVKDLDKHNKIDGWENPSIEEIEMCNRIIDVNKGNNPHTGEYDNGYSYLEAYGELFKNSTFDNVKKSEIANYSSYGFNIARYAESTKCMYFGNTEIGDNLQPLRNMSGNRKIKPYNFLGGEEYEETASLSIINSKEFHITFDDAHREFIEKDVIPYVSQMVPSTTIFSYSFEHLTGDDNVFTARSHDIICDGGICPIFGVR